MFEEVTVESALAAIYKDLFNRNIHFLKKLNASHSTLLIFDELYNRIAAKKEFMDYVLDNPYLIFKEDDLLWVDTEMPTLEDLTRLDSDDFFQAIINYMRAINMKLKLEYLASKDGVILDIIDINLKIMDCLTHGDGLYGVNGHLIKEIYNDKDRILKVKLS